MKNQISNTSASHALGTGVCGVRLPDSTHTHASSDSALGTITKLHVMPTGQGLEQNDYNSVLNRAEKYLSLIHI